ncbi:MAG: FAD-dependent oxidoreductase [Candidatus Latescibacterota bacterium]
MNTDRILPLRYDLIIIGGGVSGAIAGIAASRLGARTLVVEQHGFLGGSLTAMGVGPMMSFHNRAGRQLIRGVPQELIDRLVAKGASPGHIPDSTTYCSTVTPFNAEQLKIELESMLLESGGEILYHAMLAEVNREAGSISGIRICTKRGLETLEAAVYIDATGDGDLAALAGAPFHVGRLPDGASQPMTMNLKVGNVDSGAVRRYVEERPEDFVFAHGQEEGLRRLREVPCLSLAGYLGAWGKALAEKTVDVPRDLVLFFETETPGVFIVNTSRVQGFDPTDPFRVSAAETLGRRQCDQIFRFLKRSCPGFGNAVNLGTSVHIGVRESRHIHGLYTLTGEDLLSEKTFPDPVCAGGYPIDIHSPDQAETRSRHLRPEGMYQVPLRSLLVAEPGNLVLAGRCIGATHEASAALRVTPIAMALGQAAGTVAALAVQKECAAKNVPYDDVRKVLLKAGAFLL